VSLTQTERVVNFKMALDIEMAEALDDPQSPAVPHQGPS
jgi:hypothetical protein